jgi:hypothetical protein
MRKINIISFPFLRAIPSCRVGKSSGGLGTTCVIILGFLFLASQVAFSYKAVQLPFQIINPCTKVAFDGVQSFRVFQTQAPVFVEVLKDDEFLSPETAGYNTSI